MDIDKIYTRVEVESFTLTRLSAWPVSYRLDLRFTHAEGEADVALSGLRDAESIGQIMQAERLWLEVCEESQQAFGRYLLGVSHETYTELVFDEIVNGADVCP